MEVKGICPSGTYLANVRRYNKWRAFVNRLKSVLSRNNAPTRLVPTKNYKK